MHTTMYTRTLNAFCANSDILGVLAPHLDFHSATILHMTCKRTHQAMDDSFWCTLYTHYFTTRHTTWSKHSRAFAELELHVSQTILQQSHLARRLCTRMATQGCESCKNKRIRKIYMPFAVRMCDICFHDSTIDEYLLPAVAGYHSMAHMLKQGIHLTNIQFRERFDVTCFGAQYSKCCLRKDFEDLLPPNKLMHLDYTKTDTRRLSLTHARCRINNTRRARARWTKCQAILGVVPSDIHRSNTLATLVYNGPHFKKQIPLKTLYHIQKELFTSIYTQTTKPQEKT
eukprot:3937395-Rhodomonas_salina.2